jgi:hypothetical protein
VASLKGKNEMFMLGEVENFIKEKKLGYLI